jgi:hypothetical protein
MLMRPNIIATTLAVVALVAFVGFFFSDIKSLILPKPRPATITVKGLAELADPAVPNKGIRLIAEVGNVTTAGYEIQINGMRWPVRPKSGEPLTVVQIVDNDPRLLKLPDRNAVPIDLLDKQRNSVANALFGLPAEFVAAPPPPALKPTVEPVTQATVLNPGKAPGGAVRGTTSAGGHSQPSLAQQAEAEAAAIRNCISGYKRTALQCARDHVRTVNALLKQKPRDHDLKDAFNLITNSPEYDDLVTVAKDLKKFAEKKENK